MSKASARAFVCLVLFFFFAVIFIAGAFAQIVPPPTPLGPNSIQVSRVQYDGNTGSYVMNPYVSPYMFPEIFNDPAGLNTGNDIGDIAGIQGSIYIDQFNSVPASTLANTLSLPSNGPPAAYPTVEPGNYITTSFSSKSEGALMLSVDGLYLTYMGYQGGDQLDNVSNSYSPNPNYDLSPNSYTVDPNDGTPITITAASESGTTATITLASPVTVGVGAYFTIAGMVAPYTGYNGTWATKTSSTSSTTLTLSGLKSGLTACATAAACAGNATYDPPYPLYDREVALIGTSTSPSPGLINLTPIDNTNSGDNPRAAISVDGSEFYIVGNSDSTTTTPTNGPGNPGLTIGARCGAPLDNTSYQFGTYVAMDRPDESAKKHFKDNNWRGVGIYTDANNNQQLYVSKGSGGNGDDGLFQVGTSLPPCSSALIASGGLNYNAGVTITELPGLAFPVTNQMTQAPTPILPFGFFFANPTTLYVADEGNPGSYTGASPSFSNATNGTYIPSNDPYAGLEKWSLVNGTWILDYVIQAGLNFNQPQTFPNYNDINGQPIESYTYGLRNMTGYVNGDGTVTIYAITAQFSAVSGGESDPTSLVGITDSLAATSLPANEQFVTLQTSGYQEVFRGVAYIPPTPGFTRAAQTITFPNPGPVTYGASPITLSATATSGWPLAYTLISGPATLAGNVLTITGAGSVVVQADQSGNTDYVAASSVQDTIVVNPESTSVTWGTPAAITYGTPLSGTQLDATASVAGTFMYTPPATTVLGAGMQMLSVTFTPSDSNYAPSTGSVMLQVNQATPTVSWNTPGAITYGTALSGIQLDATASVNGSFMYTPAAGTVLGAGSQMLSVSFTPMDTADYTSASGSVMLQVNPAASIITWNTPAAITYGTALSSAQLDATANNSGTFMYTPGIGNVPNAGSQMLSVAFTPGTQNYSPATSSVNLTVNQASQSVSFSTNAPPSAAYGSSFMVAASATSTLPITYGSSGSCSNSGAIYTITSGSGTCTVTASQGGNMNYLAANPVSESTAATRATPTVTFTGAPAMEPYGGTFTVAATTNSTAVAFITTTTPTLCSLSGSYSPVMVTMLKASGICKLTASWGADANYNPASATQMTTGERATPVVTWATPGSITYGTALSGAQLDASASVAGNLIYNPPAGKIENAGSDNLEVTLRPSNGTDYSNVTANVSLQVLQAPTMTSVTPATTMVTLNRSGVATVTLDFNVTSYKPTGAVTLTASTGEVCSGSVTAATGSGSCRLTFTTPGERTVTGSYGGDSNHTGSESGMVTVTVNPY